MKFSLQPALLRRISIMMWLLALVTGLASWLVSRTAEVVVEWTTASELGTAGFNLYRSDAPDGELRKINDRLIPASTDPLTGGSYRYVDQEVIPGTTYYYQLEEVESNGSASRYGPIVIRAEPGGKEGLFLAGALIVLGGFGVVYTRFAHKKRTEEVNR